MLIRINGGRAGIKDYLENGQKSDRYYSRNELDNRLILCGDLETADNIINTISPEDTSRERYFHITLAFKEDALSEELLKQISGEFREFYFRAYSENELHFYAEAHLPKIKSYANAKTGEMVERKPHIHIVVPKISLLNGGVIDYYDPTNLKYIDAFQEHVNSKYGLASPKDNPRYKINDNSELISRYKGDGFKGKNRDIREKIFDQIIDKNIVSLSDLQVHLNNSGYTSKMRNQGKGSDKEYINIIDANGNSINLRDKVFCEEFLSLSKEQKILLMKSEIKYIEPEYARNINESYKNLLQEWDEFKAYEYKYISSKVSEVERNRYKNLSYEQKKDYIKLKEIEFNNKFNKDEQNGIESNSGDYRWHGSDNFEQAYIDAISYNIRSAEETLRDIGNNVRRSSPNQTSVIGRERRCRIAQCYARIIARDKSEVGRNFTQYPTNDHRVGTNNSEVGKCNSVDNEYSNLLAKLNLSKLEFKELVTKFNTEIQADVILELLEKTHGVNPELYRITKAADGSDRIGCGSRNLNMMDFCLNEMHFSLDETNSILSNALNMQYDVNRERGWSRESSVYLIQEYKEWFKHHKVERASAILSHKESFKEKRNYIVNSYTQKIASVREDNKLTYRARKEQINLLKVDKLLELEALNKASKDQDLKLKNQYNLEMQKAYRTFLVAKANDNDERALLELRRLRIKFDDVQKYDSINYIDRYKEYKLNITHIVDENGVINYQHNNKTIIQDHGKRVSIVQYTDANVKLTLELAMQKFGTNIALSGSEKFRMRAVDMAIKNNYKLQFIDEFSKKYHEQKLGEYRINFERLSQNKEELISDKPNVMYISKIDSLPVANEKGRNSLFNTVELTDSATGKKYEITSHSINFNIKRFVVGQFVEFSLDKTNDIILKSSNIENEAKKIRFNYLDKAKESFLGQVKADYGVKEVKQEYSGKLVSSGEYKGKFYVVISEGGVTSKVWNNDLKLYLDSLQIKKGNMISIVIPDVKKVDIERQETTFTVNAAPKFLDDLLLDIDMQSGGKKYRNEYLGQITKIKPIKLKSGRETNIVSINDNLSGQYKSLYIDNTQGSKVNDFAYFGETGFNVYDIVSMNERVTSKRNELLTHDNNENAVIGEITKIGTKDVRGNKVYFVEMRTDTGIVTKYGEKIQLEIESAGLTIGDGIILRENKRTFIVEKEQPIIAVAKLDHDLENIIDTELERLIDSIEFKPNVEYEPEMK